MKRTIKALHSESDDARPLLLDRSRSASPESVTPPRMDRNTLVCAWPSGRSKLREARDKSCWPNGEKVGRGYGQPYLQETYARAVSIGLKTVEGRPGGGWLAKGIAPNDYITFKIPGHPDRALVVCAHTLGCSCSDGRSSELRLQPEGRPNSRLSCRFQS